MSLGGVYTVDMDVFVTRENQHFVWDSEKAASNYKKHRVKFERALDVFFDALHMVGDATVDEEQRTFAIGIDGRLALLYVVYIEREEGRTRVISAREATAAERRTYEESE